MARCVDEDGSKKTHGTMRLDCVLKIWMLL